MPFRLFRLPYVAYSNVLKSMELSDLFVMSTISKRSRRCVKGSLSTKHFVLIMTNNRLIEVTSRQAIRSKSSNRFMLDLRTTMENQATELWNITDTKVLMRHGSEYSAHVLVAYCKRQEELLIPMLKNLKGIFNIEFLFLLYGLEWNVPLAYSLEVIGKLNLHVIGTGVFMRITGDQAVEYFLQRFEQAPVSAEIPMPTVINQEIVKVSASNKFQSDSISFIRSENVLEVMGSVMDCKK